MIIGRINQINNPFWSPTLKLTHCFGIPYGATERSAPKDVEQLLTDSSPNLGAGDINLTGSTLVSNRLVGLLKFGRLTAHKLHQ